MTTRVYIDAVEFQPMRDTKRVVIRDGSLGCLLSSVLRKKGDTDDTQADIVLPRSPLDLFPDLLPPICSPDLLPPIFCGRQKMAARRHEKSQMRARERERERKAKSSAKESKVLKKGQSALRIC